MRVKTKAKNLNRMKGSVSDFIEKNFPDSLSMLLIIDSVCNGEKGDDAND